jgi:cobalt-zinc-cadmium efflux system outer membrane protein
MNRIALMFAVIVFFSFPNLLAQEDRKLVQPTLKLEDLEKMALQNNPTLSQAQAQIRAAAGRTRQAGLYPNPTVGYKGDEIRGGSFGGGEQGVFVSQQIVLGGKLAAAKKITQQESTQANASWQEQRYKVLNTVRTLFYDALAAQQMLDLRRRLSELANDAIQTSHQLANVGQADQPDVLQAEVEARLVALEVVKAEQDYRAVWSQLATVVGKPDLPFSRLDGNLEEIPQIDRDQFLEKILHESPAVKRAQAELARAEATLTFAHKVPIPDLQLRAGLQQDRELNELSGRSVGLIGSVEVGVQIPIFNRNQGNTEAAQADVEHARQEVTRVQLNIRREFAPIFAQYSTARTTVETYRGDILPRAQKAYDLYKKQYQNMQAAYPQVLVSQRTLFQLQSDYVRALQSVWTNWVVVDGFLAGDGLSPPPSTGGTVGNAIVCTAATNGREVGQLCASN